MRAQEDMEGNSLWPKDGRFKDTFLCVNTERLADVMRDLWRCGRGQTEYPFNVHLFSKTGDLEIFRSKTRTPLRPKMS